VACDFAKFIKKIDPNNLPKGKELRQLMGKMVFTVEGFDSDPREIEFIPEVRRFYQSFYLAWPYWLFFCSLANDTLRSMTLCNLENLSMAQKEGQSIYKVEYDIIELGQFLLRSFPSMNWCCERSDISEDGIEARTNSLLKYFALPTSA
jgi:hypothetical protein